MRGRRWSRGKRAPGFDGGIATVRDFAPQRSWFFNWWSRSEMRDDRVALFATFLSKGTYTYTYTVRATSAGQFNVIPAFAALQYFPEVFGRSDGAALEIKR
jgi:uncharacterized protein YfaS (alpha-2-macroglobulin family)